MRAGQSTILVEGWRSIPHSYAICNSFEMLELLRRPGLHLFYRAVPFLQPHWSPDSNLFDHKSEKLLDSVPAPPSDMPLDAIYRIAFPLNLAPSNARRTCVFGTAEHRCVPPDFIVNRRPLADSMADSDCILVTCSEWSRDGFIVSGADPTRVVNIGLGYDPSLFHPLTNEQRTELRSQFGWNGFTFLNLGAMTGSKGILLLLRAFAAVAQKHPEIRLVTKGVSALYPSRHFFEHFFKLLTTEEIRLIEHRLIYFDKSLTFQEMSRLYQAADAYVSPYRGEGFNMPVLEAIASGLPVICTKGGPTDDFTGPEFAWQIESQVRHFQLPSGDLGSRLEPSFEHLLELMIALLESPTLCARAKVSGPAFVSQNFTWMHVVDRLLDVLITSE